MFLLNEKLFYLAFDSVFLPSYSTEGRKEGEEGWKKRRRKKGMERQKEKQRKRLEPVIFDLEFLIPSYICLLYSWLKVRLSKRRKGIEEKK